MPGSGAQVALLDQAGRIAGIDTVRFGIIEQCRACANHGAVADGYARSNKGFRRHPALAANCNRTQYQLEVGIMDVMGAGANVRALRNDGSRATQSIDLRASSRARPTQVMG